MSGVQVLYRTPPTLSGKGVAQGNLSSNGNDGANRFIIASYTLAAIAVMIFVIPRHTTSGLSPNPISFIY